MPPPTRFLSSLILLLVNLVPLYGVAYLDWNIFSVMFLYWTESFIIGFFTFFKIRLAQGTGSINADGSRVANVPDAILPTFFLMHYGIFMFVHLGFVFAWFWPPIFDLGLLVAFISMFISHGLSFSLNFLGNKEFLSMSPEQAMFSPYGRIIVMHLTVISAGLYLTSRDSSILAISIMIAIKTIIDLGSHLRQHFPKVFKGQVVFWVGLVLVFVLGALISGFIWLTKSPLSLPTTYPTTQPSQPTTDYSFSIFAQDFGGQPRDLLLDPQGDLLVSLTGQGQVLKFIDGQPTTLLSGLNKPHGLALVGNILYVAETDKVSKLVNGTLHKVVNLAIGGSHFTRSLLPYQGNLLVSIGSTCNVCNESNSTRASIQLLDLATNQLTPFATGLRNSVFMTTHPSTGEIYATEMGRDLLGDHLPPDEINIIKQGNEYGFPLCYGKNVEDATQTKGKNFFRAPCDPNFETPSHYDLPAHVAPLGLAFLPDESLLVALHGSWNSSTPVGYKVIKIAPDGTQTDFLTEGISRPVDIEISPDGEIYISDDKAGKIYLLTPR